VLKVGDLVQEVLPLMAGDVVPRLGILVEQFVKPNPSTKFGEEVNYGEGTAKVLFGNKIELHRSTNIRKVGTSNDG